MTHSHARHRRRRKNGSPVLRWHRRIGLSLAVLFLLVCATGFLLNHAEGLGLARQPLQADWLYRWYGMQPRSEPIAFRWDDRHAAWLEGSLYLDSRPVARTHELRGAAVVGPALVAAAPRELTLLTPAGELLERVRESTLPPGEITRIGVTTAGPPRLVIETAGGSRHVFDEGIVTHAALAAGAANGIAWSEPSPLSPELRRAILVAYRGEGLTLQRVVLDLHTGRFFGRAGVYVVDAVGVGLVFLTLTGIYYAIWGRRN